MKPLLGAALALALGVACVEAIVVGRMSDEQWFERSNKVLVLEYENPLGGKAGAQLSQLIGRLTLATTAGVERFAVVTLRQTEEHMALTPANVEAVARKQHAPVVLWGEFYEQEKRVFITSHLRYAPENALRDSAVLGDPVNNPGAFKFSWDISGLNIPRFSKAFAALPSKQVNFSPVELSSTDLSTLADLWRNGLVLHQNPDETSPPAGELVLDTPFAIDKHAPNGWSHVTIHDHSGWVRLGGLERLKDFKDITGVILYAQGLMQYVTGNETAAAATFNHYLEKYGARQDTMNGAVAHLLAGYSIMKTSTDLGPALKQFEIAKNLLPNSPSPVNCIALALFEKTTRSSASQEEMAALERDLIHVIKAENDLDAIQNLEILYQVPRAEVYFKKTGEDFLKVRESQLGVLHSLEAGREQQPSG